MHATEGIGVDGGSTLNTIASMPVIYEDAEILVIDKPSGLLSQPGLGPQLLDSVLTRIRSARPWAELVHRLDRDTSGLLLVGLTATSHRLMSLAFADRRVEKHYIGLCRGLIRGQFGTIVCPLARIGTQPPQYADHPEGRIAVTQWQCLSYEANASRLRLIPITGRSHQLRAHLQAIGHPLLGDPIYGTLDGDRLKLHAESLAFAHPLSGRWLDLHAPSPF